MALKMSLYSYVYEKVSLLHSELYTIMIILLKYKMHPIQHLDINKKSIVVLTIDYFYLLYHVIDISFPFCSVL